MSRRPLYDEKLTFSAVARLTAADAKRWKRLVREKEYDNPGQLLRKMILREIAKHEKKGHPNG